MGNSMGKPIVVGELLDAELKEHVLEQLGDPALIAAKLDEFRELAIRMDQEHSELLRLYPDKWVAMGGDGVVASADTMDELFRQLDEMQIPHSDVVHDYMNTKPESLLL